MEFSIQILPPHPPSMEKKHLFFTFFFMCLLCLLSANLARTLKTKLICAYFKMFGTMIGHISAIVHVQVWLVFISLRIS